MSLATGSILTNANMTSASFGGGGGFGGAAMGVGLFSSMLGSLMQGNAAMKTAYAQNAAAQYNARVAEIAGNHEYARRKKLARRALSSQYAGKSGVIAEEGSWLERWAGNAAAYERDALNAAIAGRNTARLERMRGASAISTGKDRRTASWIGAASQAAYTGLSLGIPGASDSGAGYGPRVTSYGSYDLPATGGPAANYGVLS
jgi:hypothetical protein